MFLTVTFQVEMAGKYDNFNKEAARNASQFDWQNFHNVTIRRQFQEIAEQGTSAMKNTTKLERVCQGSLTLFEARR